MHCLPFCLSIFIVTTPPPARARFCLSAWFIGPSTCSGGGFSRPRVLVAGRLYSIVCRGLFLVCVLTIFCVSFVSVFVQCKSKFMTTQPGEGVPFVEELLRQLHATVSDLETHQVCVCAIMLCVFWFGLIWPSSVFHLSFSFL